MDRNRDYLPLLPLRGREYSVSPSIPYPIYNPGMAKARPPQPLVWLSGEVRTPPFSREARIEAGWLLRRLQDGESIGLPHSRPMPSIGTGCHELRIRDEERNWRIVYRVEADAIVIASVFPKTTERTPKGEIDACQRRLKLRDAARKKARKRGAAGDE